jgi:DNA-directed RNA polymerase alpha subunit
MHARVKFEDDIEYSSLSPRLLAVLKTAGITRMSDLHRMTDDQLLLIPNVGHHYLTEIRAAQRKKLLK